MRTRQKEGGQGHEALATDSVGVTTGRLGAIVVVLFDHAQNVV